MGDNDREEAYKRFQAYKEYQASKNNIAPPESYIPQEVQAGMEVAGKVAGAPAGLGRVLLANRLDKVLPGGSHLSQNGDLMRALTLNAPTSEEYLTRAGMKPGERLSEKFPSLYNTGAWYLPQAGGAFDPTSRKALGGLMDVTTDPVNLSMLPGFGGSALGASGKMAEIAGKNIYQSAPVMKAIDAAAAAANKSVVPSELGIVDKLYGRGKTLVQGFRDIAAKAGRDVENIFNRVAEKGGNVDWKAMSSPLREKANAILREENLFPERRAYAQSVLNKLDQYENLSTLPAQSKIGPVKIGENEFGVPSMQPQEIISQGKGPVPIKRMQEVKQGLSGTIGDIFNNPLGVRNTPKQNALKDVYSAMREGLEGAVEKTEPGAGFELKNKNDIQSSILEGFDDAVREGDKSYNKRPVTAVDAMLAHRPDILVAKKLGDASKSNAVLTGLGLGMNELGKGAQGVGNYKIGGMISPYNLLEPAARIIPEEYANQKQNYYRLLNQ